MEYGLALIDKAAEMCGGSYYKLSKEWGVSQTMISLIRKGERKLPLRQVPKLAMLARVDAKEAMLRVAEEQAPEGSEQRDLMGKALAHGAAAMLLFSIGLGLLQPSPSYANGLTKSEPAIHRGMWWKLRYTVRLYVLRLSRLRHCGLMLYGLRHGT